ncbi:hypothetical protein L873DRAFT_1813953 [Choiromyces venosus 120613-1]|uniref:Uncharacterized protein n=1 Tax=Choiromyces venosus 120613-1 TaxID=1336337 RepID=A0A3N4JE31_9PEZI|nr:hypothetical protein L873DRAFT_1813953 [Choiromyces venosus 120613-1]
MPTSIGCERNTTIKPNTRCLTTSGMKTQSPNHNCMSYKQSNTVEARVTAGSRLKYGV